jgi:uncharacterized membrane protein
MTEVFMLMLTLAYLAAGIFMLKVAWRVMRAHERLADAVEKLAQRP